MVLCSYSAGRLVDLYLDIAFPRGLVAFGHWRSGEPANKHRSIADPRVGKHLDSTGSDIGPQSNRSERFAMG